MKTKPTPTQTLFFHIFSLCRMFHRNLHNKTNSTVRTLHLKQNDALGTHFSNVKSRYNLSQQKLFLELQL